MKEIFKQNKSQFTLIFAIAAIMVSVGIINPSFLSSFNIINIANQSSITLVLALGMTFVLITGGIDLSIGHVMALMGVMAVGLTQWGGAPLSVGILAALGGGLLIGLLNGLSIAYLKVAPLITTLAMGVAVRSIAYVYTDGANVFPVPDFYEWLSKYIGGVIPKMIVVAIILVVIFYFILKRTKYGRFLYAVGGNPQAAKFSGINNNVVITIAYTICGLCAGIAGILMDARLLSGMPSVGNGTELMVIAAVVIGGTSLSGGKGTVIGTVLGVFLISLINNIVNMLSIPASYNGIVTGIVIFIAAVVDALRTKNSPLSK